MLNDWNTVAVIEGSWTPKSKCDVKSCKRHAKFLLFNDYGAPKMSRLFFCCCAKHLSLAVRRGWDENRTRKKKLEQTEKKT